jgi:hypothetical protein
VDFTLHDEFGRPVADAVVSVQLKGERANAASGASAGMGQRNPRFVPTVLVVPTGTPVTFPVFDAVRHPVYSFSPINPLPSKLPAAVPSPPAGLAAYVRVVNTSHFAMTDAAGHARPDLPPGEHRLQAWHGRLPEPGTTTEQALRVVSQRKEPVEPGLKLTADG